MLIRLQKYLADNGVCARRKAERLIVDGRVAVNGTVVTELGAKADDETDEVAVDGVPVKKREELVYIMLNKPRGYVTTVKDQFGRPAAADLVSDINVRIYPVGRLDYDTSGLLLMTNDGALAYKLMHPKHNVKKTYIARAKGAVSPESAGELRRGVFVDGVKTSRADVDVLKTENNATTLEITITEGRNRQVRKMLEAVGHNVISLKRVAIGDLDMKKLKSGEHRRLTDEEINYLLNL